jgi:hypothetical protein
MFIIRICLLTWQKVLSLIIWPRRWVTLAWYQPQFWWDRSLCLNLCAFDKSKMSFWGIENWCNQPRNQLINLQIILFGSCGGWLCSIIDFKLVLFTRISAVLSTVLQQNCPDIDLRDVHHRIDLPTCEKLVYCPNQWVTITNAKHKIHFAYIFLNCWNPGKLKFETAKSCFL